MQSLLAGDCGWLFVVSNTGSIISAIDVYVRHT